MLPWQQYKKLFTSAGDSFHQIHDSSAYTG